MPCRSSSTSWWRSPPRWRPGSCSTMARRARRQPPETAREDGDAQRVRPPAMTATIGWSWEVVLAIAGLALLTLLSRGFFLLPEREVPLPDWLRQGMRYAPLAALVAVIAPEVV